MHALLSLWLPSLRREEGPQRSAGRDHSRTADMVPACPPLPASCVMPAAAACTSYNAQCIIM